MKWLKNQHHIYQVVQFVQLFPGTVIFLLLFLADPDPFIDNPLVNTPLTFFTKQFGNEFRTPFLYGQKTYNMVFNFFSKTSSFGFLLMPRASLAPCILSYILTLHPSPSWQYYALHPYESYFYGFRVAWQYYFQKYQLIKDSQFDTFDPGSVVHIFSCQINITIEPKILGACPQ